MAYVRRWLLILVGWLSFLPPAQAETRPAVFDLFHAAMQQERIVRLEVVQMTSLIFLMSTIDSLEFDGLVVEDVYSKRSGSDCDVPLDPARRARMLSEFDKYSLKPSKGIGDITWRIIFLDAKGRIWHSAYVGRIYTNTPDVLLIVDGRAMTIDRRFVEFLDNDKTLNRCRF